MIAAIIFSSGAAGIWRVTWQALAGVVIGIAIGGALAYLAAFALRRHIGAPVQCVATFVAAYGGYFVADRFGWSGIFTVLTFGIALRQLERRRISVAAAESVDQFWKVAAIVANVALFFLIGAALDFRQLAHALPAAAVTIGAVLLARALLAYGLLAPVRSRLRPFWRTVVQMAGIRGALSLALALSTPTELPQRALVVNATFAVVVATILVSTLTLPWRLKRLDLEAQ
jgi:CPA1 family monovalent cation:H+ antiporter